jgi:hypothetical protein
MAACGAEEGQTPEVLAQTGAGLSSSPMPTKWAGTLSDLAAADGWSQCSFPPNSSKPIQVTVVGDGDRYLNRLAEEMDATMEKWRSRPGGTSSGETRSDWIDFRNDQNWNHDDEGNGASAGLQKYDLSVAALPGDSSASAQQARDAAGAASMNLCMALVIRQAALRGDTLAMPEAEQQKLVETVRERAQMSALQYAGMLRLAAIATNQPTGVRTNFQIAPYIKEAGTNYEMVGNWVKDLATAVQLHISATSELAEMFGRSASAHTPRGGNAATAADEEWGPGSWRQRGLALLYGGNPLAGDSRGGVPWSSLLMSAVDIESQKPGVAIDSAKGGAADWPGAGELPYVKTELNDSRVRLFRDVASSSLQVPADGGVWFNNLDATFRQRSGGLLGGLTDTYGLLQEHGIAARKVLEESTALTNGAARRPFYVFGGVKSAGTSGTMELSENLVTVARPLVEYAASFARMTPFPWPIAIDARVERVHSEGTIRVNNQDVTVRIGDDLGMPAGGIYTDSMRLLGAVPSLLLVRDALQDALNVQFLTDDWESVASVTVAAIDTAIGRRTVKVRALDDTAQITWKPPIDRPTWERIQASRPTAGVWELGWRVDANVEMPANRNTALPLQLYSVRDEPLLYPLTLRPGVSQYGRTIESVVDVVTNSSKVREAQIISVTGDEVQANVFLPESMLQSRWGFVLRVPLIGGAYQYVMLAQGVQLRARTILVPEKTKTTPMYVPLEGQFYATGGWFGQVAERLVARRTDNPARPRYDGFGLSTSWVPSADATAYGGSPGEAPVTFFLRNAKQSAFEATDAIKVAFEGLMDIKRDDAEMQAAEARSSFVAAAEQQRLCGNASSCNTSTTQTSGYASSTTSLTKAQCKAAEDAVLQLAPQPNETAAARENRIKSAQNIVRQRLTCITQKSLAPYKTVTVSSVVVPYLGQEAQPTFSEYAGGALQKSFIEQWAAVRQLRLAAEALDVQVDAAAKKMSVAFSSTLTAQAQIDYCAKKLEGAGAEADLALQDFKTAQATEGQTCLTMISTPWDINCPLDMFVGFDPPSSIDALPYQLLPPEVRAAMDDQMWRCKAKPEVWQGYFSARAACAQAKQATEQAKGRCELSGVAIDTTKAECKVFDSSAQESHERANSDYADAIASLTSQRSELAKIGEMLAMAVASQAQLKKEAELATERQQLEASLAELGQQTSFKLWRSLHHYDSWRARALLDGARRYAVAARRAIEARYLVDLSTMKDNEPFVAAPYLWADNIYRYDLSLPAAVGVSIAPNDSGAVYANQVLDYVGNLEKFVSGFAVQRPASAALHDGEVLSLPGPKALWEDVGQEHAGVSWMVHCAPRAGATATLCNGAPAAWCAPSSAVSLDDVCQATLANGTSYRYGPERARIVFELDPWGRFGGTATLVPFQNRVNARWDRLVVNLVGAGIQDCSVAADPTSCWSQPFLRYSLSHRGPVTGISYDSRHVTLDIPTANIEGGKALAANELLDPVLNGWGKPYVEAIARSEFLERPLGGNYALEFELPAGASLDSIERVQLLLTSNYWTLQTR